MMKSGNLNTRLIYSQLRLIFEWFSYAMGLIFLLPTKGRVVSWVGVVLDYDKIASWGVSVTSASFFRFIKVEKSLIYENNPQ